MHHEQTAVSSVPETLFRRRWLAVVIFAAGVTAAVGTARHLPDMYRATATIVVVREGPLDPYTRGGITGELESRVQSITQEMLTRARLELLIDRFGLYPDLRARGPMEDVVNRLRGDIKVEPKNSGRSTAGTTVAFTLSYVGTDPPKVAEIANTLARTYVAENLQIREGQARGTAQLLKAQLDDVKQRLGVQDREAASLRERYGGELPEQTTANLAAIDRLNAELRFNNDRQQRLIDRRDAIKQEPPPDPRTAPDLSPAAKRVLDLKDELATLRARFTEQHPDVRRVAAEIAEIESQPAAPAPLVGRPLGPLAAPPAPKPVRTTVADVDKELQALLVDEKAIRTRMSDYERRVENAPQRDHEIKDRSRDFSTTVEIYYSLLKRYEDARLAETIELTQTGDQFRIQESALIPTGPAAPTRWQLLLMGVLLSAALAGGAVFLAEQLDSSIHTLDELRGFARVPVLATIAPIVTSGDRWRRRGWFVVAGAGTVCALTLIFFMTQHFAVGNVSLVRLLARGRI
jgi:polysaccharide chain length determinant protein (PEP-CTERM system associated)